jgi:hypothetical protein
VRSTWMHARRLPVGSEIVPATLIPPCVCRVCVRSLRQDRQRRLGLVRTFRSHEMPTLGNVVVKPGAVTW